MSGITSAGSGAISRLPVVAAATGGAATGGAAAVPGVNLPVVGELPFTGAPLALVVAVGVVLILSGLAMRTVAFAATKRAARKSPQSAG